MYICIYYHLLNSILKVYLCVYILHTHTTHMSLGEPKRTQEGILTQGTGRHLARRVSEWSFVPP